jgi:hypothetical protein
MKTVIVANIIQSYILKQNCNKFQGVFKDFGPLFKIQGFLPGLDKHLEKEGYFKDSLRRGNPEYSSSI